MHINFFKAIFISSGLLTISDHLQAQEYKDKVDLPKPYATPGVKNFSKVIGWPAAKTPTAPKGFTVTKFADQLENPR